ncbi:MAG TPA: flagellar motor protein MotB [Burkholderiaceae bacterium]|nr:flagellar motor protein MotB [Burkholderiaceae bacterium]
MASDKAVQPIIIKRIKKVSGGHHGAAWKIAYADFVTAMMAFFLLMWLLGSTTKGDLKGISDYFTNPIALTLTGGSGAGDATSLVMGGGEDLSRRSANMHKGQDPDEQRRIQREAREAIAKVDQAAMAVLKDKVQQAITNNPKLADYKSQVRLDVTKEGLRIQIVDEQGRPMFDTGSAVVKDYMRGLLREIAAVLNTVDYKVSLSGHTDSRPFGSTEMGYSNWELSADRANASRRELLVGGMQEQKIVRVVGLAASQPMEGTVPDADVNRRISIVVLTRAAADDLAAAARAPEPEPVEKTPFMKVMEASAAAPTQGVAPPGAIPSAALPAAAVPPSMPQSAEQKPFVVTIPR